MQKILLNLASTDMTIARNVFKANSPNGIPICGKGTRVTDELIKRLESMDVQTIYVEGHPIREEGELAIENLLQQLDARFAKTLQEPLNAMLYNVYKANLIKSMGGESGRQAK